MLDSQATADDFAAINQGQLKHLATQAIHELQEFLPGGAGSSLLQLQSAWQEPAPETDDFVAINIGQTKHVAAAVYDRLIEVGYTTAYPWAGASEPADDYALVNIGQVKNLFSFDITLDTNDSGLPDWWELHHLGNLNNDASDPSPGGSGLTLGQAFELGIDPNEGMLVDTEGDVGLVLYTRLR